jgi:UDP-N-acetylmuramoyl-tripeptide--D-alanyl-D-alanine ligase
MSSRLKNKKTYAGNTTLRNISADYMAKAQQLQPAIKFIYDNIAGHSVLSGDYNFDNIMAAVAIGKYLGVSSANIVKGITTYEPKNNRSQWIQKNNNLIFLDAYNANPSSMEAALRNFAAMDHPHKTVIMGDMFEMGDYAKTEHQRMVDLCLTLGINSLILVGEEFYQTKCLHAQKFKTTADTAKFLMEQDFKNFAFFIKGSRGMRLETLIDCIK